MRTFIREKKIHCGSDYMEVDLFSLSKNQISKRGKRAKKERVSLNTQKNLNDKNARRRFLWICEANFSKNSYSVTLTYSDEFLPDTLEGAERELRNYLRRVARRRKKEGLGDLKYIVVTSSRCDDDEEPVRVHHHVLMNDGLDRDVIEGLWRKSMGKGKGKRAIGFVNCDRIRADYNSGIQRLCSYLSGNPKQKRRWSCSQNLARPWIRNNDHRYSRRVLNSIATEGASFDLIKKLYPGYAILDKNYGFKAIYNEFTGWSVYLKLRRLKE